MGGGCKAGSCRVNFCRAPRRVWRSLRCYPPYFIIAMAQIIPREVDATTSIRQFLLDLVLEINFVNIPQPSNPHAARFVIARLADSMRRFLQSNPEGNEQ